MDSRTQDSRPASSVSDTMYGTLETNRPRKNSTQEAMAAAVAVGAMVVLVLMATLVVLFGSSVSLWGSPGDGGPEPIAVPALR